MHKYNCLFYYILSFTFTLSSYHTFVLPIRALQAVIRGDHGVRFYAGYPPEFSSYYIVDTMLRRLEGQLCRYP